MNTLRKLLITAGILVSSALPVGRVFAQVVYLDHQHMDFRVLYDPLAQDTNRLDIQLRYNATATVGPDFFYATNQEVYIVGNTNAKKTIPANPNFAFLGTEGSPVWSLPQTQNTSLPFLGTSGEDLPDGIFDGLMKFELMSVEGPGNFFVWQAPSSTPIIYMIWTNGVINTQYTSVPMSVGNHAHYAWGFSTNGLYRITFRCSGQRVGESTNIIGKEVAWAFQILPLRPWEQWVSTNWLPATATNIAGPNADPDGDGLVNVMEYALNLDPNVFSTNGRPFFSFVTDGPDTYGALTFTRVKAATDLSYEPSVRSELSTGDWETLTNVTGVIDNGDAETVTVRDAIPVAVATTRFYQFRVRLFYP